MDEIISVWKPYIDGIADWQPLIKNVTPKQTDCGPVFELSNPIDRPNESFAICDMRGLQLSGAHYHTGGETEFYFVIEGQGTVVVGGKPVEVMQGSVVVTPPDVTHFTISNGLVLAVVNTPPFSADNYRQLDGSKPDVGFDQAQYESYKPNYRRGVTAK